METKEDDTGNVVMFSHAPETKAAIGIPAATIRSAITKAYGKLLGQLESKGLVTLTQTMEQAIEAAAQARADKTGDDVGAIRAELMKSVKKSAAMRLWVGSRTVNDAIIPETPEYAGSTTGDLAHIPQGAGVPAGPIRVPVGQAFGPHRGFGVAHMADNAQRDPRRAPKSVTGDLAEDLMRQTVAVLGGVSQVHDDGSAVILVNPSSKMAVVANWRDDHYSVVSVRPYQGDPQNLWGIPNRVGRLTFPTRDAAATSPSTTDAEALKLRQGRTGLDVKSEKFDLTNGAAQQQAAPTVTVKNAAPLTSSAAPTVPCKASLTRRPANPSWLPTT